MKIDEIQAGTPASIVYVTDTRAAVVVKRTPKRVTVLPVVTGPVFHENADDVAVGDFPVVCAEGILSQPLTDSKLRTYTLREREDGSVYGDSGKWGRLALGSSVTRTDYRY